MTEKTNTNLIRKWNINDNKYPEAFKLPKDQEIVFFCIGTDKSTGDSLGPFIGSKLKEAGISNVYGTIEDPIHAVNIEEKLCLINDLHPKALFIAIDSALTDDIEKNPKGTIKFKHGKITPGSAISRVLPSVGELRITGTIGELTTNEIFNSITIQNTRLNLIIKMANSIAHFLLDSLDVNAYKNLELERRSIYAFAM